MISIRDLKFKRGSRLVLDIPSLDIGKGEAVALIGPNGAGKSTLLQVMACLLPVDSGTLRVLGEDVTRASNPIAIRRRTAMVLQRPCLLSLSVFDNVALGLKIRGIPAPEIAPRVEEALQTFGISHLARRPARALSGGESQRVSLARAFALKPEILFLDEPFSALDLPTRTSLVREVAGAAHASGATTVFVTHDVTEIPFIAHRAIVIENGRITADGSLRQCIPPATRDALAAMLRSANWLMNGDGAQDVAIP
ncbi:MAG: Spermidine/putrescine import ATP-binding protein PotA [Firmicutes bacterium ADurb.Bin506]|nr:MAG: Spermidine/putrescine import ATP-binding protein PotA [Firmicutes bacterium ADurb.Bin506]